jgi:hypothetical protein
VQHLGTQFDTLHKLWKNCSDYIHHVDVQWLDAKGAYDPTLTPYDDVPREIWKHVPTQHATGVWAMMTTVQHLIAAPSSEQQANPPRSSTDGDRSC